MALITSLFVVIVVFGLVGAATAFSTTVSLSKFDLFREVQAFYLAETGLETAKWELGEALDPDGNGAGNRDQTVALGSYRVTAQDLGSNMWQLDATATVGEITVSLEEVVEVRPTTAFPISALTLAGALPPGSIQIKSGTYGPGGLKQLIIDGGNSSGVGFTDQAFYDETGTLFADYVNAGDLDVNNLSGTVWNDFNGVDLPFQYSDQSDAYLDRIATVHEETKLEVQGSLDSAVSPPSGDTWGSSTSPGNFVVGAEKLVSGQTVSGHGRLVVTEKLEIEDGATLNWDGDIIVYGNESLDSDLVVKGDVNMTGNLIVLGQRDRYSKLTLTPMGTINVDGALTSVSDPDSQSQLQFLTEGQMNVDGILSILGPKNQTEFKDLSDTVVNGMIQIGAPTQTDGFLLKWEGDFEVHKDDTQIQGGIDALDNVGVDLGLSEGGLLLTDETEVYSVTWRTSSGG